MATTSEQVPMSPGGRREMTLEEAVMHGDAAHATDAQGFISEDPMSPQAEKEAEIQQTGIAGMVQRLKRGPVDETGAPISWGQSMSNSVRNMFRSNKVAPEFNADGTVAVRKKRTLKERALVGSGTEEDAERHAFTLIMMSATLFALWGPDLYEVCGPPSIDVDSSLYTLITIVFCLFMIEFAFYTLFKPGYVGSFFFYLDFLAAISLLPDVLLLWNIELFGASGGSGGLAVARAGRAARAGTRAARVVRIFKLFSLMRRSKKKDASKGTGVGEPSKVGTKLTNGITQKVIIIVALMLISSQLLDLIATADVFIRLDVDKAHDLQNMEALLGVSNNVTSAEPFLSFSRTVLNNFNSDRDDCIIADDALDARRLDTSDCRVRYLRIGGIDIWGYPEAADDLRTTPPERVKTENGNNIVILETIDAAQGDALINILTVAFVTIVLAVASALFSRDSDRLVIGPLETMARMVRQLQNDPLTAMNIDDVADTLDSETKLVADALLKLSAMLQVGFGDAGGAIIQQNMQDDSSQINPVIPGKRINAIYGFCDIRNFTDCTECLQQDVMVFVNRIADFVHRATKDNEGAPNKNIGDAFLLAWPLPEQRAHGEVLTTADSALRAMLRIVVETAADEQLTELTSREAVQKRIPGYVTRFGIGLHYGWGIVGAIGSVMKIDATYLSPHVNMSARLEGATKQYGCIVLMTDVFYDMLTPPVQKLCRRIDRVTAVGATAPFDLYTYDSVRYPDVATMQQGTNFWERFPPGSTQEFRDMFAKGVKAYIDGDWGVAKGHLETCTEMWPNDGPTKFLLGYIAEHGNHAPAKWTGYRINGVD